MAKYTKRPTEVEAITFDELTEHGLRSGVDVINGMPRPFEYNGQVVTPENHECYVICTTKGSQIMTPNDMLIIDEDDQLYVLNKRSLELLFDRV